MMQKFTKSVFLKIDEKQIAWENKLSCLKDGQL